MIRSTAVLELAILGLLADNDLHGYELKRRLEALTASASYGSLYPALNRLARRGVVRVVADAGRSAAPPVPMTGSLDGEAAVFRQRRAGRLRHSGKARKVYALTDTGRARLHELMTDGDVDEKSFGLKLAFASLLDHAERAELVGRRRRHLDAGLVDIDRHMCEQSDPWRQAALDRQSALIDHELAWLDAVPTDGVAASTATTPITDRSTTP